jgi:hypothetical protein
MGEGALDGEPDIALGGARFPSRPRLTVSKQRKRPASGQVEPARESASADKAEQVELGNQALQAAAVLGESEHAAVRDVASPMVRQAVLALQIITPPNANRSLEILERSNLPEERKALLIDHVHSSMAMAEAVGDAVACSFGENTAAVRDALLDALDDVRGALDQGWGVGESWHLEGQTVALSESSLSGSLSDRADGLLGDVAASVMPADLAARAVGGPASATRALCSAIWLRILLDEEEEEDLTDGFGEEYLVE